MKEKGVLGINENVYLRRLVDGTKYILIKTEKEQIPLFMKHQVMDIIQYIQSNQCTKEDVYDAFGNDIDAAYDLLEKFGIVCERKNVSKDIYLEGNFDNMRGKLFAKAYVSRTPQLAKMEITYHCNYRCKYCYVDGIEGKCLPFEDLKVIFNKLKQAGVNELYITGGEPFVHPDILKIIDYAYQLRFIVTVQTNASFLDDEMVRKLKKYRHITYGISFHSSKEDKFDEFTQVKGSFQKTVEAGRRLKANGIPFFFKLIVTKENQDSMKENIAFLEKNKFDFQVFTQILPSIEDAKDNFQYTADRKNIEWLYENKYLTFKKSTCSALRTKMWISSTGDVYPCELTRSKVGNLIYDSFEEVWFGEQANKILTSDIYDEPTKCQSCKNSMYCNKCLAYKNYKNWKGQLEYFCNNASIVKKYSMI